MIESKLHTSYGGYDDHDDLRKALEAGEIVKTAICIDVEELRTEDTLKGELDILGGDVRDKTDMLLIGIGRFSRFYIEHDELARSGVIRGFPNKKFLGAGFESFKRSLGGFESGACNSEPRFRDGHVFGGFSYDGPNNSNFPDELVEIMQELPLIRTSEEAMQVDWGILPDIDLEVYNRTVALLLTVRQALIKQLGMQYVLVQTSRLDREKPEPVMVKLYDPEQGVQNGLVVFPTHEQGGAEIGVRCDGVNLDRGGDRMGSNNDLYAKKINNWGLWNVFRKEDNEPIFNFED